MKLDSLTEATDQPTRRATSCLLQTQGFLRTDQLLSVHASKQLAKDIERSSKEGPCLVEPDGSFRAVALLAHSDLALKLLDDQNLALLINESFSSEALLSTAEGVIQGALTHEWRSDFLVPRSCLASRSFRPGITFWMPVNESGGIVEVKRSSQHLESAISSPVELRKIRVHLPQGNAILLEGSINYRLASEKTIWLRLCFVRSWMKPEILFATALTADRLKRLGQQGCGWCGLHIGLPTTVKEFLSIEEAALESEEGRAKGSGI
jgi:hypothetical protein